MYPSPSGAAVELCRAARPLDAHMETSVWMRAFGYDPALRHGPGPFRGRLFSQADVPRMRDAGFGGVVMSVATNPLRSRMRATPTLVDNLNRLEAALRRHPAVALVSDHAGFVAARGRLSCFLAVQGGAAYSSPSDVARTGKVSRVTLVHLTDSVVGASSAPFGRSRGRGGLRPFGAELIQALAEHHVLVDLAHASRRTFRDALGLVPAGTPVVVSHTGLAGVWPSWRNIDDDQVRAVAQRGGVVGVMFHRGFLGRPGRRVGADAVVAHLEHAIAVGGEDVACLGSDWDGLILPPPELRTVAGLPHLVDRMLAHAWSEERVVRVLSGNYSRVLQAVRPGVTPSP